MCQNGATLQHPLVLWVGGPVVLRQINGWTALCLCWVSGRFQQVAVTNNTDTKSDLNSTLEYRMPNSWRFTRCSRNAVGLGCRERGSTEMCLFHNVPNLEAPSRFRSFRLTLGCFLRSQRNIWVELSICFSRGSVWEAFHSRKHDTQKWLRSRVRSPWFTWFTGWGGR